MYEAPKELKSIIEERTRLLAKHFAARDAVSLVEDYYAPDELQPLASGDDKAVIGREAIVKTFAELFDNFSEVRQVPLTIRWDKDLAYEVSNAYFKPRESGGEIEFRYIAVWRRCTDTWRVETDFFAPGHV